MDVARVAARLHDARGLLALEPAAARHAAGGRAGLPLPPLAALILLYVAVEEVVFRGVVIAAVGDAGMGVALAASVTLFVGIQVFNMPSWRAAMFPVLGALVVGVVHGALYLAVPDITPLIVAHFVLFMVAAT